MPIKLTKVEVTVSGAGESGASRTYICKAPKGLYDDQVGTACGIREMTADNPKINEPVYTVAELIGARKVSRITVRVQEGTKIRTMKMLCSISKIGTVDEGLKGKTVTVDGALVSGGTIRNVVGKRDASFS